MTTSLCTVMDGWFALCALARTVETAMATTNLPTSGEVF